MSDSSSTAENLIKPLITYADFEKVDIRSGTVVQVEPFPEARKAAYKIWVDFGPDIGIKKTSAQVTDLYTPEKLMGRSVAGVVNFGTKQIANFASEFLLVGFSNEAGHVCLVTTEPKPPNGQKLH